MEAFRGSVRIPEQTEPAPEWRNARDMNERTLIREAPLRWREEQDVCRLPSA